MIKVKKILSKIGFNLDVMYNLEEKLAKQSFIKSNPNLSPIRFEIMKEAEKRVENGFPPSKRATLWAMRNMYILPQSLKGILTSYKGALEMVKNDPPERDEITIDELKEFENILKNKLDIIAIGYTKVEDYHIFKNHGILYNNAIICIMEMDRKKIGKAPSCATGHTVHKTYAELGKSVNKASDYLKKMGFGAHASHPLNGSVLTPPLAVNAGLGWQGTHGLIIIPEIGPCMRIAAIFTNIKNLPLKTIEDNEHKWIEEFCKKCSNCVATCPTNAYFPPFFFLLMQFGHHFSLQLFHFMNQNPFSILKLLF